MKRISASVTTVDQYIELQPTAFHKVLKSVRKAIREAAPQAKEGISYMMPAYKHEGPLVYFGAFKNHCSFFCINKAILEELATELEPFHTSGTTIHFTPDNPLPAALVKKIVKIRVGQNEK
ncbi:MAG TPA: DUF1801 domain-containing protein [Flavisolibacter sp.]|jgi:uncharacterized protein YdhG (YjbR/CyaY superfamily)|nr:DUF1801 domain-containing protein [Flavisolibacter sp.]